MQKSTKKITTFSFCICLAIKPKINDQLSQDENLENSLKMANARPVEAMTFTGPGNNNERGKTNYFESIKEDVKQGMISVESLYEMEGVRCGRLGLTLAWGVLI